jgi:ABC-type branched-subunit amino acid transport system permease subunit
MWERRVKRERKRRQYFEEGIPMVAIVTVLFAFPLGFFLRNRTSAYLAYVAIFGYSFTFQTLYLLRAWIGDNTQAFAADPEELPVSYLGVTAGIYAVGFLIITLAHRLATKRRARATTPLDLDAAR